MARCGRLPRVPPPKGRVPAPQQEEHVEMTQAMYQPEERARQHRLLTEQAIELALGSRWEEAAAINQRLLETFPRDLSALNRLGKALSELGDYTGATRAYTDALEVDPDNNIAKKNLERLSALSAAGPSAPARATAERIDPRLFIEETGKTTFTTLVDLAPHTVIARLSAGDQVYLQREGTALRIANAAGEHIGRIEPRLAARVTKFMDGGNQYAAGITEIGEHEVRVIIRETFQDPKMFGRVSFPAQQGMGETIRPYIKDTMVRYEQDDEDELTEDGEYTDESEDEEAEDTHEPELEEDGFMVSEE